VINAAEPIGQHDGVISVATGTRVVDAQFTRRHVEASDLRHGEYVTLEVRVRAKIFDPFFSTKFTGRGLGLRESGGALV
jgi:two-component system cell cycle sensor histidine kinase/response regulator CckA